MVQKFKKMPTIPDLSFFLKKECTEFEVGYNMTMLLKNIFHTFACTRSSQNKQKEDIMLGNAECVKSVLSALKFLCFNQACIFVFKILPY